MKLRYTEPLHLTIVWKNHPRNYWYSMFLHSWMGCDEMSAYDSLKKFGIAARYLYKPEEDFFDCYIPDPDNEGYVFRMIISQSDVEERFRSSEDMVNVCREQGITLMPFIDARMADKLNLICKYFDIFEFFEIEEEIESEPIEDIVLTKERPDDSVYKVIPICDQFR